jgi:DNA-directed RNA polymerase specialized sigma54-like protein
MVNVLDVLETIKSSSSTSGKTTEASKTQAETKLTEAEAAKSQAGTKAGPSKPVKEKSLETGEKETEKETAKQILPEGTITSQLPKHLTKYLIILYDMLREKGYLKKKSEKLNITPRN